MVISILMNFILDFASLVFALNSIGGEVSAGRWDLLRMTPMPDTLSRPNMDLPRCAPGG
jgi:hypothetical protein